jgi:hypothetical protein
MYHDTPELVQIRVIQKGLLLLNLTKIISSQVECLKSIDSDSSTFHKTPVLNSMQKVKKIIHRAKWGFSIH